MNHSSEDHNSQNHDQIDESLFEAPKLNNADFTVKNLLQFEKGDEHIDFQTKLNVYKEIIIDAIGPMIQIASPCIGFFFGFWLIRFYESEVMEASLGLYLTYINFFCYALVNSIGEKLGVEASEYYAEKRYSKMKTALLYGLMTFGTFYIFLILPLMLFSFKVMRLVGVEEDVAHITSTMVIWSLPTVLIIGIGDAMKTYCYSQGIETPFGFINIGNSLITMPLMYLCVFPFGMGIYGFVVTRTIYEIMNFSMFSYVFFTQSDQLTIGKPEPEDLIGDFMTYFVSALKFFSTAYFEWFGFEINTVYVSLLGDTTALAAYVCWNNFSSIFYSAGIGIGNIMRTRVNFLLGMKKNIAARNFFFWFCKYNFCFWFFIASTIVILRNQIASFYTKNHEVHAILSKIFFVYFFIILVDTTNYAILSTMRSVGKINDLLKINFGIYAPMVTILGGFGVFVLRTGVIGIVATFCLSSMTFCFCVTYYLYKLDWKTIDQHEEEHPQIDEHQLIELEGEISLNASFIDNSNGQPDEFDSNSDEKKHH